MTDCSFGPHLVHNGLDSWEAEVKPLHVAASGVAALELRGLELAVVRCGSFCCPNAAAGSNKDTAGLSLDSFGD
jgi:hypothetical protein